MKMRLKAKRLLALGICFLGVGLLLLGKRIAICTWIGVGLMAIAVVLNFTIRCPHCGRQLAGKGWGLPNFCPRCGADVHEE